MRNRCTHLLNDIVQQHKFRTKYWHNSGYCLSFSTLGRYHLKNDYYISLREIDFSIICASGF